MSEAGDLLDGSVGARLALRWRWTRGEFERAGELGLFDPTERLELIGGEVIRKVTPQKSPHATAVSLADGVLRPVFQRGHYPRVQLPLALGEHSEPEPDLAVVKGSPRDHKDKHPAAATQIVEIADSTLAFDRVTKGSLYAQAGVAEYWIVNLRDRVLEVHREPAPMADQPFGHHYRSTTRHSERDIVSPLGSFEVSITVGDLLP